MSLRPAALYALLVAAPLVAMAQDAADSKPGDKVDILWNGKWYPGVVLKTDGAKRYVRYDGYSENWDAWVPAADVRARAAAANPPAAGAAPAAPGASADPAVGERCEGSWNNGWYEVDVLEAKDGKFRVHWRGYGADMDEWVARDRLRHRGEETEILPRKGREGNGGGLAPEQLVGKPVEVFWHGKWWPAVVQKTDGARLFIRYTGGDFGKMEEWAVKERVREVGGAVRVKVEPADVPGKKGLDGLWWRTYMGGGKSMTEQYFRFYPDGHVILGIGFDPDEPLDVADARQEHADVVGAYGIEGDKLNIQFGGDADEWKPLTYEPVNDRMMKLNGIPTMRARTFPKGTRLEGRWLNIDAPATSAIGGLLEARSVVFIFRADGTYRRTTTQTLADTGIAAPQQNARGDEGTYELEGNHLALRWKGDEQSLLAQPLGHEDAPYEMMRIGEAVLKRRE